MADRSQTDYAEKFELLLELFPHPKRRSDEDTESRKWRMIELQRATNGRLKSSALSALRHGKTAKPGMEFLDLIAQTMRFPFELWLTEPRQWDRILRDRPGDLPLPHSSGPGPHREDVPVADLLEQLISSITNRRTGKPFTNAEIADRSSGRLTEEDVRAMRSEELENPTREQLLALCDVFDVDFSYWSSGTQMPTLSQEDIEALRTARNSESRLLMRKSLGLEKEQIDVLIMMATELTNRLDRSAETGERSNYDTEDTDQ